MRSGCCRECKVYAAEQPREDRHGGLGRVGTSRACEFRQLSHEIPDTLPINCATLGNLPKFSELFPQLLDAGHSNPYFIALLCRHTGMIYVQSLAQSLAQRKCSK